MPSDLFGEPLSEPLIEPLKEIIAKLCSRSVPIKKILSLTGISKVTYYNYINDDCVKKAIKSFQHSASAILTVFKKYFVYIFVLLID